MTDYFFLFSLPRRPLIDLSKLNEAFARTNTGNQAAKQGDALVLNEAFRVLSDTVSRLEHLLALESVTLRDRVVSAKVEQWFGPVAQILHRFDEVYYQLTQEPLQLLRATKFHLLQENLVTIDGLSSELDGLRESLERQLQEIDTGWPNNRVEALPGLAQLALDLRFVQKWRNQLKERKLRFDELH
jgi:hypothetical protein